MKRVSIRDVAREAGVSATTVSYVLNRNPGETISAETTQRVPEAVRRLHYVPNLNARSLSSRRSNLIGVLIPQTEPGKEFMFYQPLLRGTAQRHRVYRPQKRLPSAARRHAGGPELCERGAEPRGGRHHHRGRLSGPQPAGVARHERAHRAGGQLCQGRGSFADAQ